MAYHIKKFNTIQDQIDFCYNNENLVLPIATINDETNEIVLNNDLNLKYYVGNTIPSHINEDFQSINFEDLDRIPINEATIDDTSKPWYILLPNIYEYNIYDSDESTLQNAGVIIDNKIYFRLYKLYTFQPDYRISVVFVKK